MSSASTASLTALTRFEARSYAFAMVSSFSAHSPLRVLHNRQIRNDLNLSATQSYRLDCCRSFVRWQRRDPSLSGRISASSNVWNRM